MSVDLSLSSINKSIFVVEMPIGLSSQLLVSSLRKNPKRGFTIAHSEVKGLRVKLMFNKNIIKPKDDIKYIKKAADAIVILHIK